MPIEVESSDVVTFTDTSSSGATSWLWNFGDGTTSTSQNPTHTYTGSAGDEFTVRLTVTWADGLTATVTDTVTIAAARGAWSAPDPAYGETLGADPKAVLRISNDGGKTWVAELEKEIGRRGEWDKRIRWNRLGSARRRVFELVVSDPVQAKVSGAFLETE